MCLPSRKLSQSFQLDQKEKLKLKLLKIKRAYSNEFWLNTSKLFNSMCSLKSLEQVEIL